MSSASERYRLAAEQASTVSRALHDPDPWRAQEQLHLMAQGWAGGMLIDVTTDVKDSVVMPEVFVPANASSVTVPVQGGKPGTGSLFFRSSAGESTVNVTVTK